MNQPAEIPDSCKAVDMVMITYNTCSLTLQCIESVYSTCRGFNIGIILVDNASIDDTVEKVKEKYPSVKIICNPSNLGYSKALNIGLKECGSDIVITCNNDIIYHENSIKLLLDFMEQNPEAGVAGPQQIYPGFKWEYSWGYLPGIRYGLKRFFHIEKAAQVLDEIFLEYRTKKGSPKDVEYLDGAVFAIRKKVYDALGGFDEDFVFYTDDTEFCHRVHLINYSTVLVPQSVVTHLRGGSTAKIGMDRDKLVTMVRGKMLFCKKYGSRRNSKAYFLLERWHSLKMYIFWLILQILSFGSVRKIVKEKTALFKMLYEVWKEEYESVVK